MRRIFALILVLATGVLGPSGLLLSGPVSAQTAGDDARRGLNYAGLQPAAPESPCRGGFEFAGGRAAAGSGPSRFQCSPGPDPAPEGVNVRENRPPEVVASDLTAPAGTTAASGGVGCYGSGTDGFRVQAVYARSASDPDRFADYAASFAAWAARIDQVVGDSAAETGGIRHVRFATDPSCQPVIERVTLSAAAMGDMSTMISELRGQGYGRTDRKYLVWADANVYCGISEIYSDDRADTTPGVNYNNGNARVPGEVARIDNGCWGRTYLTEAHEMMHTLGGVQPSAPNATPGFHCTDESDRLCYTDASTSPGQIRQVCPPEHEALYDCNHDDYFSTAPPPGSYLSSYWNTANSAFLTSAGPPPPPPPPPPPTTTTTTTPPPPPPPTTTTTTTPPPPATTTTTTTTPPPPPPPATTTTTTTTPPPPPAPPPPPPPASAAPSAPRGLSAVQPAVGSGVLLRWQAPATGPVTGYRIYRGPSPYALSLVATVGNVTSYSDTSASRQLYFYVVRAFNDRGEGPPSNTTGMIGKLGTSMSAYGAPAYGMSAYGQLDRRALGWSVRP